MLLTPSQLSELTQLIDNFHLMFIAENVGTSALSSDEIKLLKKSGIDIAKLPKEAKVAEAFKFGVLVEALGDERAKEMSYKQFKTFLQSGSFIPISEHEKLAIKQLEYQSYNDIKGLGNKISKDFKSIIVEYDQKQRLEYEKVIKEEATEAILHRKSVSHLASQIGHRTGDWARDLDRIADYTLHNAFDTGIAHKIIKEHTGDALVYKDVYQGACKYCQGLYLTAGTGSKPKVFKLKTLVANGSNIGRKAAEWLPVVGPTHPWCRCQLNHLPAHADWNPDTRDFTAVKRITHGVKRKSKAKITVT